jgi:hypothetical protein
MGMIPRVTVRQNTNQLRRTITSSLEEIRFPPMYTTAVTTHSNDVNRQSQRL